MTVGLSAAEAARAQATYGRNELPRAAPRPVSKRILNQLRDPMILLLLGASVVTIVLGDVTDTFVIFAVIILNTAMGVIQEVRAERALAALEDMTAPTARVMRDGALAVVPAAELVPGDLVHLDAGDIVPADAVLVEVHQLGVDESAMTGESVPVEPDLGSELHAGTVLTKGRAVATVTRTGVTSNLGRIAQLVASAPVRQTPLQRRLSRLSRTLVLLAAAASTVVLCLGLLQGRALGEMLVVAVSLAVAAVPESLPAVVSVALALGAYRMARRSAIVRRLPAVEALGSVSVIATDKTGTLTEGRMVATQVWTPQASYVVSGIGYAPTGDLRRVGDGPVDLVDDTDAYLERLLRAGALCNDAHLLPPETDEAEHTDGGWRATGDPLEAALLALAGKAGVDIDLLRETWPRLAELPFDTQRRLMTTRHSDPAGRTVTYVKGAPETVLEGLGDEDSTAAARQAALSLARAGHRVIALSEILAPTDRGRPASSLLGLVAISDPPRAAARDVVRSCHDAGVRVVMITGDHAETARAIATDLGITDGAPLVATGDALDDPSVRLDEVGVFARTRPEQKVGIVRALQENGHVVAMTGDGVNDAPALRAADIGVAMGKGGTEVARQAAALVLGDDDLRTVVVAIEEGRRILANIRAFLRYALSGGFAEVVVMVLGPFLGMPIPLLPGQILWVNMLTHGLPGVAFGAEPVDPAVMKQPSRSPDESVLGQGLGVQVAWIGSLIATVTLVAGVTADATGAPVQTHVFFVLGMAQLVVALALRAPARDRPLRRRTLELAVLGSASLQVAAVYVPALQALLHTHPISTGSLVPLVLLSILPGAVARVVLHRRAPQDRTGSERPEVDGPRTLPSEDASEQGWESPPAQARHDG